MLLSTRHVCCALHIFLLAIVVFCVVHHQTLAPHWSSFHNPPP